MFTKGEWTIEKYELSYRIKGLGGSVLIATVHSSPKTQANARLIAQAPKLYEACKKALRTFEAYRIKPTDPRYITLKQAIALVEEK